jgi:hypothetical protein
VRPRPGWASAGPNRPELSGAGWFNPGALQEEENSMFAQKKPVSDKLFMDARTHYEKLTTDILKAMGLSVFPKLTSQIRDQTMHTLAVELDSARGEGLADMDNALRSFKTHRQEYVTKIKAELTALLDHHHGVADTDRFKLIKLWSEFAAKLAIIVDGYDRDCQGMKAEMEREKARPSVPAADRGSRKPAKDLNEEEIHKELSVNAAKMGLKVKTALTELSAINQRHLKAIQAAIDKEKDLREAVFEVEAGDRSHDADKLRSQIRNVRAEVAKVQEEGAAAFHQYTQWYEQGPGRGTGPLLNANGLKEADLDDSLREAVLALLRKLSADHKNLGELYESEIALALRALGSRLARVENQLPKSN